MPAPHNLDELLCHLQCFSKDQRKKDRSDCEPDTMSSFQKTPASHWQVNFNFTVLLVLTEFKNMSVDPEDWDVDFAFPDFNLAFSE